MKIFRILLIEDDEQIRTLLSAQLRAAGYAVTEARNGAEALRMAEASIYDAALMDIHLPDMTGIEILGSIRRRDEEIDVVMMTGFPEVESAVQALRLGAYDYLIKPLDVVALRNLFKRMFERRYLREEVASLRTKLAENPSIGDLIGTSAPMKQMKEIIAKVAPTDSVVLVEGESGTGKELIAGAIHKLSQRAKGPFVPVNCSAIPSDLIESELFGHIKGSFSGAAAESRGLFRTAEQGTIFLDEIGEIPIQVQPKLLRVLQEKEVRPVGSPQAKVIDVRIVAATNQNLAAAVKEGRFRQDLFFRLNVVRIQPPPLREMKEDIPTLVMHIARKLNRKFGRKVQSVDPQAMDMLKRYDFPGNVRELENILERAYALGANVEITAADLPSLMAAEKESPPARSLEDLEREFIAEALKTHENNKEKTAQALGLSERTLYRRLKKLGLS